VSATSRSSRRRNLAVALTIATGSVIAGPILISTQASAQSSTAKVGGRCTTANAKSTSGLVCTRRAGRLVWARPAATTTTKAPAAAAGGAAAAPQGIEGAWKATTASQVGYRVKEVLNGQDTEGVGRTNAVTGTMTIAGTKVTVVDLSVDMTKLASDSARRDGQVQGRILDTAKFPTSTLKLKTPIDFGTIPADKAEVKSKATVTLTMRGTTKDVELDLVSRRNGANIEVNGSLKIVFEEWGIPNPSLPPFVTTDPEGLLEFLVVFGR
jgi:polyisoprenoid-binding protein YceI